MLTIFSTIVVFLLIIALHEFGHFIVAKLVGIRVNEFSIGMGPQIYGKETEETVYSLRALPIGGYVSMEGEEERSNDPRSFNNASVPKRIAVCFAGAGMNFVLAVLAFTLSSFIVGFPVGSYVGAVQEGSPAKEAGILPNDEIVSINGATVSTWDDILDDIGNSEGEISVEIRRGEEKLRKKLSPIMQENRKIIGITAKYGKDFSRSIQYGFTMTGSVIVTIGEMLGKIFSGEFSVKMLSGPVGVVQVVGDSAKNGMGSFLFMIGFISANLGFMNLLPIPALDGGKIIFLLIEGIFRKPVSEKLQYSLSLASFVLLFGLMIYVTIFSDLARILG